MMDSSREPLSPALEESELGALREAIGHPTAEQVATAVEEVERQVALEDLLILMIEAIQETVRAFFDFLIDLESAFSQSNSDRDEGDRP